MFVKLESKIQHTELTKTEERIANYILANFTKVCFFTLADLSAELGVSDASIVRFSRAIGYAGFTDMQKDMQTQLVREIDSHEREVYSPSDRMSRISSVRGTSDPMSVVLDRVMKNFAASVMRNPYEKITAAAEGIIRSRHKYVVGFKGCQGLASKMVTSLSQIMPGVRGILHGDSEAFIQALDLGPEDCVILFSFARYSEIATELYSIARQKGAAIIALTDHATAPIAGDAQVVFTLDVDGLSFMNSHVVTEFYSELLVLEASKLLDPGAVKRRLEDYDQMIGPRRLY